MRTYKVCINCILSLQKYRSITESQRIKLYVGAEKMIECKFMPRCFDQPERSKREDAQKCEMRCSEHCRNTVRDRMIQSDKDL